MIIRKAKNSMGTLFDDLDNNRVNASDLIEKDNQEFCINPDNLLKVLCPDDEPRLVISSRVNKSHTEKYIRKLLHLIRDMLVSILDTESVSKLVILDDAHALSNRKMTNIMLSFRVNVRTTYSAIKLLNAIRRVFLGEIGGAGFDSADINLVSPNETIFSKYLFTLNFYFFNKIRREQFEDNGYEKYFVLFENLGIHLKDVRVELKKAIDKMDCRYSKNKKLILVS